MKSTAIVSALALVAAVFSVAAQAQTGRPATVEVQAAADTPSVAAADQELGSYGRYLMLNGAPRDVAVAKARSVDHPAAQAGDRKVFAAWGRARTDAQVQPRQ